MTFEKAVEVEQICEQMRLADDKRSQDRALIDKLFNGSPPYSDAEVEEHGIFININDLSSTRLAHDARAQFAQNFLKPGQYFSAKTDWGKAHQRSKYSNIVSREIAKVMKRSLDYFECFRSKFAMDILHGIGPAVWEKDRWCPEPLAIGDMLVPADTLLSFKNLPFFAIRKSFTAPELIRITKSEKRDKGWNMPLVEDSIKWIDKECQSKFGSNSEIWNQEKLEERIKGSGGLYAGDAVPTVDAFDFHYWSDAKNKHGWRRRIILDTQSGSGRDTPGKNQWLYDSGDRVWAQKRENIFSCQFADLSAVAPFKYHTVRSLGFLMYAVCHVQNRLRCRFNENVLESMTMYFRTKGEEDVQRALKVNLVNRGFIDKSLEFVPANERFQVRADLVQLGLQTNQKLIEDNVASYRTNPDYSSDNLEKTKFQVQAELSSQTQLVSAAIQQAYQYQLFEYREIFRRFCNTESTDPDVLEFRASCLKQGVPEELLANPSAWDIEPERVMGGGNKAMEVAIAQQLMQMRQAFDPEPQRQILHDVVLAMTDDPARARNLVPETPEISNSVHDAQLAFGALFVGAPVSIKSGLNLQEYIQAMIVSMATVVGRIEQTGGMATPQELIGLQNVAQHIGQNIEVLGQDEQMAQEVKVFGDQLTQLQNLMKGYSQRLEEQSQSQNGNGGMDQQLQAELASKIILAQAKAQNTRDTHAEKTSQRRISFEQQFEQKQQDAALKLQTEAAFAELELQKEITKKEIEKKREAAKSSKPESRDL